MHPPQGPLLQVEGRVALNQPGLESMFGEFFFRPDPGKEATFVLDQFGLNNKSARQRSFGKDHMESIQNTSRIPDSYNPQFGDRNNEAAATETILGLLRKYFVGEVPCQQEHVRWHLL